jgi:hypothetical protein
VTADRDIARLRADIEQFKADNERMIRENSLLRRALDVMGRLGAEVGRLTLERDNALIALGRQTYTAPYRELVAWDNGAGPDPRDKTDAEWIAIGRLRLHAAGLAVMPVDEGGGAP